MTNPINSHFTLNYLLQMMKRHLNELNDGAVRKERGKITLNKLKIWWKNERRREKRIQNREMEKASQRDGSQMRKDGPKTDSEVYVDDSDDIIVSDSGSERISNLQSSNDPLLGVPSPHRGELSSPSPHRPEYGLPIPQGVEPSSQRHEFIYRQDLGAVSHHLYRQELSTGSSTPYRHDLSSGATSPYRQDLGSRSLHAGEYAQIMQQDYPGHSDRSPEHQ